MHTILAVPKHAPLYSKIIAADFSMHINFPKHDLIHMLLFCAIAFDLKAMIQFFCTATKRVWVAIAILQGSVLTLLAFKCKALF